MSNPGGGKRRDPTLRSLDQLGRAVEGLLESLEKVRAREDAAQARRDELEALLRRFEAGDEDPAAVADRLHQVEAENRDLKDRIERGRVVVDRLLSRIRFLEEQR